MPRMREATRSGWKISRSSRPFADTDELDGLAGDGLDGKRRAAPGIALHLGQDDPGEFKIAVEFSATVTASWPVMASATKRISESGTAA
jgi:hypothetical protein